MEKFLWMSEEDKRDIEKVIKRFEEPYVENQNYVQIVHDLTSKYCFDSFFTRVFHFQKYKKYQQTLSLIRQDEESFECAQISLDMLKEAYSMLCLIELQYKRSKIGGFQKFYYNTFRESYELYCELVQDCIIFSELSMSKKRWVLEKVSILVTTLNSVHSVSNYFSKSLKSPYEITNEMYEIANRFSSLQEILEYSIIYDFPYCEYKHIVENFLDVSNQRSEYDEMVRKENEILDESMKTLPSYLVKRDIKNASLFDQKVLLEARRELLVQALEEDTKEQITTLDTVSQINQLLLRKEK